MKRNSLFFEATQNIKSGTSRAVTWCLVLLVVMAGGLLADAHTVRQIYGDQRNFVAAGGATTIVENKDGIDGERCVALNEVSGVRGAYAAKTPVDGATQLRTLPGTRIHVREVAGDYLATLGGVGDASYGIGLPSAYGQKLGLASVGTHLPLGNGDTENSDTEVAAVFDAPNDKRDERYSNTFFVSTQAGQVFDECVFTVWPVNRDVQALAYTVLISGAELNDVKSSALNSSLGDPQETDALLLNRTTRYVPLIIAVVAVVIGAASIRVRRLELALAQSLGVKRTSQLGHVLIETTCWVLPATLLATAVTLLLSTEGLTAAETRHLTSLITLRAVAIAMSTIVGVLALAVTIRASKVYTWFKDR